MSTISNVSSSASAYATQALQQRPTRPSGPPPELQAQFAGIAESFGLGSSEASSLMSEIDSIMQDAQESGKTREEVESQLASVLDGHGIDAQAFKAKLQETFDASGLRAPSGPPPFRASEDTDPASEESARTTPLALSIAESLKNLPAGALLDASA